MDKEKFGKRLRMFREQRKLTQREVASKIGVSEQAVSKWEVGSALPDIVNLKLLARLLRVSADCLLDTENDGDEKVIDTIRIGGARFEVVEKPAAILAGWMLYAKDFDNFGQFDEAIMRMTPDKTEEIYANVKDAVLPSYDIHLSVNFWKAESERAFGFVRETTTDDQPDGVDVYHLPPSLYIRGYTDRETAQLLAKDRCDVWEMFSYIRNILLPAYGFRMASNGAQEMEVYDTSDHRTGYAYLPVERVERI